MILVAACPGGNISNFFSQMAGGNAALSISLTAFSTGLAIVFTPLNLQIWGSAYAPTREILQAVHIDPYRVFETVVIMITAAMLGIWLNHTRPKLAQYLVRMLRPLSMIIFVAFVVIAFENNYQLFLEYFEIILSLVLSAQCGGLS
ncbi:MAG: bile acid:sodium symporter [Owenweeksia sp.]|nr:bile acid:sodium symporter [Owenweeksia sp.]